MAPSGDKEGDTAAQTPSINPSPVKRMKELRASILQRKLPVPNKVLQRLIEVQKDLQPNSREAAIESIVHFSLTDKQGLNGAGNEYLLKRLITGVSTSVGNSRQNYATILMRITKAHLLFVKKNSTVDTIFAAVEKIYGDKGTFRSDYSRGLLDKTLGALVSTSAIVRGTTSTARKVKVSEAFCGAVVRMLRRTVSGAAHKWCLGPAALDVLRELLDNITNEQKGALMKPLWKWAEDRKSLHDGLSLGLILLMDYNLISADAFVKLYPKLSDVTKPLMAIFDTGFPVKKPKGTDDPELLLDDLMDVQINAADCPRAWGLMLKYLNTNEGRKHFGGISAFWRDVVLPNLRYRVHSTDKKVLLLSMLPPAIALLDKNEPVEAVLNSYTLLACQNFINWPRFSKNMHGAPRAIVEGQRMYDLQSKLPSQLTSLCTSNKISDARRVWLAEHIVRWVANNLGNTRDKDILRLITDIPSTVPSSLIDRFFSRLLYCFLFSNAPNRKSLGKAHEAYLDILDRTTTEHPDLANLFIYVCIMSSIFEPVELNELKPKRMQPQQFLLLEPVPGSFESTVEQLQKEVNADCFSTLLPMPNPSLTEETWTRCFTCLQDLLLRSHNTQKVAERVKFAGRVLENSLQNMDKLNVKLRSSLFLVPDDANLPVCFRVFRESIKRLDGEPPSSDSVSECLRVVGRYLQILFFKADLGKESELFCSLEKLSVLFANVTNKVISKDMVDEDSPTALEKTVHLLCVMCGENESLGSLAKCAIGLLGDALDDSATAVLFDVLDATKKRETEDNADDGKDSALDTDEDEDDGAFMEIDNVENTNQNNKSAKKGSTNNDKDANGDEETEENETVETTDVLDADINPDTEDPAVLAAFDKHLSNHMKLLTQKGVKEKTEKAKIDAHVGRLLALIGSGANILRLRIERRAEGVDEKTVAVFFDLFLRLIEFISSEEFDGSMYAKRVAQIYSKNLSRKQVFIDGLAGLDIVSEFGSRLFSALTKGRLGKSALQDVNTMIRRLGALILQIHVKSLKDGQEQLIEQYENLWKQSLKMKAAHADLFTDFAESFPTHALAFARSAHDVFADNEKTDTERRNAVKYMSLVRQAAVLVQKDEPNIASKYWGAIFKIANGMDESDMKRVWKSEQTVQAVVNVLRCAQVACVGDDRAVKCLDKVKEIATKQGFHKIQKNLSATMKRPRNDVDEVEESEEQTSKKFRVNSGNTK